MVLRFYNYYFLFYFAMIYVFNHLAFSLWVEDLVQILDQNVSISAFDGVVSLSIFLFLHYPETVFFFSLNFLLMEFRWANNFLFFKKSLGIFCSCLNSASFFVKVKCFALQYHFINFALTDFWCFVWGELLFWQRIITDVYDIFRLMFLIFFRESLIILVLCVYWLWCFPPLNNHFCLILLIQHNIAWR